MKQAYEDEGVEEEIELGEPEVEEGSPEDG